MDHIEPKKVHPSLYTASVEAIIQLWVEFQTKYYCSFAVRNLTFISCRLIRFHNTFKTPKKPLLSKLQQKSFSMASKRGQKHKVTKMNQFWDLIINIICEDCKNAKIIKRFHLGEAVWKIQLLYYCGLNVFLTAFAKCPLLRSDCRSGQNFLKLFYLKGYDKCPKE